MANKLRTSKAIEKALLKLEEEWRKFENLGDWYNLLADSPYFVFQTDLIQGFDIRHLLKSLEENKEDFYLVKPWEGEGDFLFKGELKKILRSIKEIHPSKEMILDDLNCKKRSCEYELQNIEKAISKIYNEEKSTTTG